MDLSDVILSPAARAEPSQCLCYSYALLLSLGDDRDAKVNFFFLLFGFVANIAEYVP